MAWSAGARAVLTALLTLLASGARPEPGAQRGKEGAEARLETFAGTLEEAATSAYDRNVPLILIAILESEDHDVVSLQKAVVRSADLARASRRAVLLLANNGVHPAKTIREEIDGAEVEREVCSVYHSASCSVHQKPFDEIYNAYNEDGELKLPFVAVLMPDRREHRRFDDGSAPSLKAILSALEGARKKAGEGLTENELREARVMLTRSEKQVGQGDWGGAWRSCGRVLEITQATRHADTARERRAACLAGFATWREEALALLEAGQVIEGYQKLLELEAATPTTPLEKEIPKLRKQIERDKRFKDRIAAYRLEREAKELLDEAERLFRSGDERKGQAVVRKLLRKYAGTKAAIEAGERWPY